MRPKNDAERSERLGRLYSGAVADLDSTNSPIIAAYREKPPPSARLAAATVEPW